MPRICTRRSCTACPSISASACKSIRFDTISSAIPIIYSALRRDNPTAARSSGDFVAMTSALLTPLASILFQIDVAAAREICCPTIARANVSKLAGSDLSGGAPYCVMTLAISGSIALNASRAPPDASKIAFISISRSLAICRKP